ncbi:Caprin-2, partial [Frankliniella fusca]
AFRQRNRERARRALNNLQEIQYLRALVNNHGSGNESSSGSEDGNLNNTDSEVGFAESESEADDQEQGNDMDEEIGHEQVEEEVAINLDDEIGQEEQVEEEGDEVEEGEEADEEEHDNNNQNNGVLEMDNEEQLNFENYDELEQFVIQNLKEWGSSGGVLSMSKLDELLGRLCPAFPNLPKSYKTLLSTAKKSDILRTEDFKFWHKGIKKNLDQRNLNNYLQVHEVIQIDFNIDGLPLSKGSSKMKFWPILGKLVGTEGDIFIVALYCGTKDPADIDIFLGDLVLELNDLMNNGYTLGDRNIRFEVRDFILDAPARSLVKCCIGHAGYGACEKCTVHGVYLLDRINFAHIGPECTARTDESYSAREDRLHHTGRSPLELIEIGMVSQFRLDTLHLLYKGVFSRLLDAILTWEGPWNMDAATIREVSNLLLGWKSSCPMDFNRKPRPLEEWYKYKATELRRFLLYDSVVAFQNKIHENLYRLLLLLHSSIYILASSYLLPRFSENAEVFLNAFVTYAAQIFGDHFVSYNVHSLTHLVDECRVRGVIEEFSAFPYDNALKSIKETLRSGYLPLEQVLKRDSERSNGKEVVLKNQENLVQLHGPHVDEQECERGEQFSSISVNRTTFKINEKDSVFMTVTGQVMILKNIIFRNGRIFFVGNRFQDSDNFYLYPIESSKLGIFQVWNLNQARECVPLSDVFGKCWLIKTEDSFFVVVRFTDGENTEHEAVSRKWLHVNPETTAIECWWPEFEVTTAKLMTLVTKHQTPDCETWASHPCEIIKTYGAYLDAHLGAKRRTTDKNYETEKELGPGKRKRIPNKRLIPLDNETENKNGPKIRHADVKSPAVVLPAPPAISVPSESSKTFQVGNKPVTILSGSTPSSSKQTSVPRSLNIVRKNKKGSKVSDLEGLRSLIDLKKSEASKKTEVKENFQEVSSKSTKGTPSKILSAKDQASSEDEETPFLNDKLPQENVSILKDGGNLSSTLHKNTIFLQVRDDSLKQLGSEGSCSVSSQHGTAVSKKSSFKRPASKELVPAKPDLNSSSISRTAESSSGIF